MRPGWLLGEVQVWCCRCGGAGQGAGMLWVPAVNSSARGGTAHLRVEHPPEQLPGQYLTSTENLAGETYREKKNFGQRDFIALGLCEENNQCSVTA